MAKASTLTIKNLRASIEGKEILKGVSLVVKSGEVHAVMGPNGNGKSTLANVLAGHPGYKIKNQKSKGKSEITIDKNNLLSLSPEERAKAGLFLAFQSPIAIPGVNVVELLRASYQAIHGSNGKQKPNRVKIQNPALVRRWKGNSIDFSEFTKVLKQYARVLRLDDTFLRRGIHDGFSGGEKKKLEMLQALVLKPKFAIFDEIDTGLDVDALKLVASSIKELAQAGTGVVIITHYQRILNYLRPDYVHILVGGKIVASGDAALAKKIEKDGYQAYSG